MSAKKSRMEAPKDSGQNKQVLVVVSHTSSVTCHPTRDQVSPDATKAASSPGIGESADKVIKQVQFGQV